MLRNTIKLAYQGELLAVSAAEGHANKAANTDSSATLGGDIIIVRLVDVKRHVEQINPCDRTFHIV
jgi:hypothetical protein